MYCYVADARRYGKMRYRYCGNSGLQLPMVSLGLWHNFGTNDSYENMKAMCFTAFDTGITHFDLANNYGPEPGSAELNFGRIVKEELHRYRDELVVSTKAGYGMWDGPYGDGGSRKYLLASLDQSLARMGLDYVDIFYHHRMDPNTPLEETMLALCTAVQSGRALYVGLSNYDGETMAKAAAILQEQKCPFIINQNSYSLLNRTIEENGLKEEAIKQQKGLIIFSPLAQGLLTNKYLDGIPKNSRVDKGSPFLTPAALTEERLSKIGRLNAFAKGRGQSLAQMALSWLFKDNAVTSVLVGASQPEQILENARMLENLRFTEEELQVIEEILQ
ncbi:MAG: L-glyceraldehyde 3-phosphate reductase [Eubacteriales bacterium]|nr:L-glyceraldehyde 3-phosphate reductase [Eubacteriales bacterium]